MKRNNLKVFLEEFMSEPLPIESRFDSFPFGGPVLTTVSNAKNVPDRCNLQSTLMSPSANFYKVLVDTERAPAGALELERLFQSWALIQGCKCV